MKLLSVLFILLCQIAILTTQQVHAQSREVKIINNIKVTAEVPGFNLYLSGLFSPNSNIVLYNKKFLSGLGVFKTDSKGYFSFKISLGYIEPVELCVSGVAVDNLDSRPFCFEIDLKKDNYYIKDIYLSPTLQLISENSGKAVRGYTMPNSSVIAIVDKNVVTNSSSDQSGFYQESLGKLLKKDHEVYVYAVGENYVTKESRYAYFSSEGSKYEVSQNYIFVDSLYSSLNSNFWYIVIFLVILIILLLVLINREKLKAILESYTKK